MLRSSTRQEILHALEQSFFGSENYSVDFPQAGLKLLHVKFIPDMRFALQISHETGGMFKVEEAPGIRFLSAEAATYRSLEHAISRIGPWTDRIREELVADNPFAREVSELRNQLESRLADLGQNLSEFFTIDEAEQLRSRLSSFEDRLNQLASENTELRASIEKLNGALTDLRDSVTSLNKGTWLRMSAGRLLSGLKAMAKSKEAREFALEAAKKVLLEGPK